MSVGAQRTEAAGSSWNTLSRSHKPIMPPGWPPRVSQGGYPGHLVVGVTTPDARGRTPNVAAAA